jgi:hypothetical protein
MARLKTKSQRGLSDFKDANGLWVRSYTLRTDEDTQTQYHTRAGVLFSHIKDRCRSDSYYVKNKPAYKDCENDFKDFQSFTDWCQDQYGYMNREDKLNQYWSIDKDILVPGNKVYSESTCIFVPSYINSVFAYSQATRGEYPIGVDFKSREGKFRSSCRDNDGKQRHLGYFTEPFEAHRAWQLFKVGVIRKWSEDIDLGVKLQTALVDRAEIIEKDHANKIITLY